ncbi:MAG TPA: transposase [Bryobacteraceae bacterium]|jgi:putative DNA methylase
MDRLLDQGSTGPRFLQRPDIAQLVESAVQDGEHQFHRYQLHAYVVMPNHVHLLVTPNVISTRWLGPLKGFTGYRANQILDSQGKAFWQDESYDHLVRTGAEFERINAYIEQNPVAAGLVAVAEEFVWSSAKQGGPPERRLQPGLAAPLARQR